MKILLISPAADPEKRTNKGLMMPQLALYILQGLTPSQHIVETIEEEIEEVDLNSDCDLVAISYMTANAPRAYELCAEFKKRGKTVIVGGVHPTILPDEAAQHADTVVIGEAEGVWETVLEDFEKGRLQKQYHDPEPDLSKYVPKDYSKIIQRRLFKLVPIMTTRGCPYNCDFCCVTNVFGKKIRHISIENVVRDIKESGSKNFLFLDDNIIGHPRYARELFEAIKPLKIKWGGQASVTILNRNPDLMKLAVESGCRALFLGVESVSEEQMESMQKASEDLLELKEALRNIRKSGILVHASMVFGFDTDKKSIFDETLKFLMKTKVATVSFNVLTPYPGTKTYQDLKNEGRLISTNWKYYDHNTVVYQPKNMTPEELQAGKLYVRKKFYTRRSIFRRLWGNMHNPFIYLAMNLGHVKQTKVEAKRFAKLRANIFDCPENTAITQEQVKEETLV